MRVLAADAPQPGIAQGVSWPTAGNPLCIRRPIHANATRMNCAYVGIVTQRGLEVYYREDEHTARFLIARLRRRRQTRACCIWFVMDEAFDTVLVELLAAGHADGAWAFRAGCRAGIRHDPP